MKLLSSPYGSIYTNVNLTVKEWEKFTQFVFTLNLISWLVTTG